MGHYFTGAPSGEDFFEAVAPVSGGLLSATIIPTFFSFFNTDNLCGIFMISFVTSVPAV